MSKSKRPDCLSTQLARALKSKFNRPVIVNTLLGLPDSQLSKTYVSQVLREERYLPIPWVARTAELLDLDINATVEAVTKEARERGRGAAPSEQTIRNELEAALAAYPLEKSVALGAVKPPAPSRRASDKTGKSPVNQLDLLRRNN